MDETIQIDDRWYVLATSSRTDDRTRVLKHGDTFAVFDRFGDIHRIGSSGQGIYHQGTRFLSVCELRLNDRRPMLLNSSVRHDNGLLTVDLTTPDLYEDGQICVLRGTVHLFRAKLLWQAGCHEHLRLMNYGEHPVRLRLSLLIGADYADIFEVRGFVRERRGEDLPAVLREDGLTLGYRGLDNVARHTIVKCSPAPSGLTADRIDYALALEPHAKADIYVDIMYGTDVARTVVPDYAEALAAAESSLRSAQGRGCRVCASNEPFTAWIDRSAADLVMLTTDTAKGPYPYAGVPWFSTPFGRDGILTALQCLWVDPMMARGVLGYLASAQADAVKPEMDAEPGKILHETRQGELVALGEIPFGCYYGSIDSTPLFVVLAGAYYERTGDLDFVRSIWSNLAAALNWIDRYGDTDGDGFLEYRRRSERGLVHQGWKDSEDAVFHRDGTPVEAAVALAEVQGYVYLAKLHATEIAHALGEQEHAAALRREAVALQERFERAFWSEELGTYAMALDGDKRPCLVRSSNAGQVLWSGIASAEHARRTAQTLLAPSSFSGWGVRTIAECESRYNPMSYHNGSIWPHDNALIAMGLARYGMKDKTLAILDALFDVSQFMDMHRLPELYCGFVRRSDEGPTLYPVACSPQAWASASVFYLLQACLGMSFRSGARVVCFDHPLLPPYLARVEIRGLAVGDALLDLSFVRHEKDVGVNVLRKQGDVSVSVVL